MKTIVRIAIVVVFSLIVSSSTLAQQGQQTTVPGDPKTAPVQSPATAPKPPPAFGLTEDTPVRIKLARTMTSKEARVDDRVDFEVLEDVKVGDTVVIERGAMAVATVTEAHPKRRMGRAGKLHMNIDYVRVASGEKVPLRAVKGGSGGNHIAVMTGAMVATGIVFFPAAPLFLFMHGKDITIPQGTEITAFVDGDMHLDMAHFGVAPASVGGGESLPAPSVLAALIIASTPPGADIEVDGGFVGSTPSTLSLPSGSHQIVVKKKGFADWTKTLTVTGGNINLNVELEQAPGQ